MKKTNTAQEIWNQLRLDLEKSLHPLDDSIIDLQLQIDIMLYYLANMIFNAVEFTNIPYEKLMKSIRIDLDNHYEIVKKEMAKKKRENN